MSTARPSLVWSRTARLAAWVALLPLAACSVSEPQSVDDTRAGSVTYVRSYSVDPDLGAVAVSPTGEITYAGFVRSADARDPYRLSSALMFRTSQDGSPAWTRELTVPVDVVPQLAVAAIVDAVADSLSGEVHVLAQFDPDHGTVVVQVDGQGRVLRRRQYGSVQAHRRTEGHAIVARPGGGFVVAGRVGSDSQGFGLWMLEVGRDGTVLRERSTHLTEHSLGIAATSRVERSRSGIEGLAAVDGGYLVWGSKGNLPWLARVDTTLAVTWERRWSTSHGLTSRDGRGWVSRAVRLPASPTAPVTYVAFSNEYALNPLVNTFNNRERMTRFDFRDGSTLWDAHWRHERVTASPFGGTTEDAIVDRQGRLVTIGVGKPCNPLCDGEGHSAALLRVFRPEAIELIRTHQPELRASAGARLRVAMNAEGDYFVLDDKGFYFDLDRLRLLRVARSALEEALDQSTAKDLPLEKSCEEIASLQSLPNNRLLIAARGCVAITDEQGSLEWMLPAQQALNYFTQDGSPPLATLSDGGSVVGISYLSAAGPQTFVSRRDADGRERWSRSYPGPIASLAAVDVGGDQADRGLLALRRGRFGTELMGIDLNDGRVSFTAGSPRSAEWSMFASAGEAIWLADPSRCGYDAPGSFLYDRIRPDGQVTHSYSLPEGCYLSLLPDGNGVTLKQVMLTQERFGWLVRRMSPVAEGPNWISWLGEPADAIWATRGIVIPLADGGAAFAASVWFGVATDVILVRLDAAGRRVFARRFGTAGSEAPSTLTAMPDGGFLITGWSTGFEAGRKTLLAIRTDADGRVGTDCGAMRSDELVMSVEAAPDARVASRQIDTSLLTIAGAIPTRPPLPVESPLLSMVGMPAADLLSARACIAPSLAPVLRVSAVGNGVVSSVPGGIACGPNSAGSCAQAFATGTSVRLEALASAPDVFVGWLGQCSEAASAPVTTVILNQSATCEARFAPPDAVPSVTFADAEFDDGAWSVVDVRVQPSQPVGATWRQVIDAGNPGKYREMHDQVTSGVIAMSALHINMGAVYEPGLQGAVSSLHYSEDRAVLSSAAGSAVQSQALLEQGGRIFTAPLGSASTFSHADWRNASATLFAADFQQLSGPACAPGQACPDFSAVGAPMRFGYMRGSRPAPGSPPFEQRHGIDNWQVTVHRRS
jgi:hypothetical protein